MTESDYQRAKRSLQVRIGRGRAQTRRANNLPDRLRAMKDVQLLEHALSRLNAERHMADGA